MASLPELSQPPPSPSDTLSRFDTIPLFMQSLPKELGGTAELPESVAAEVKEGETNPSDTLAALQALAYDGDPSEIAENFRTQGNDLFKRRKFRDAIGFYTRALDEVGKELPTEERRTLRCNRAAANLELGNYGACLRDCSLVLSESHASYPDPPSPSSHKTTMKALLRSARALSALDKLAEALDAFSRLRMLEKEVGEEGDSGRKWREETECKVERKERREREERERERRSVEERQAMVLALTQRGVVFPRPTAKQPLFSSCPTDVTPPHFDPDVVPLTSLPSIPLIPPAATDRSYEPWQPPPPHTPLIFPTFLLLPLASPPTRDLIMSFPEDATFGDALVSMGHDPSSTQLYLSTLRGRVLKIGSKMTLGKVLVGAAKKNEKGELEDGWELKEGWALEMVGVPRGNEGDEWVRKWKEEVKEGAKAIL
ncbi:40S ribosomal protein s7 [Rhodotorula toruloides]|uniref:40S ribosomal protein s7 n=1 Tax=Rhodotorula toruloides TaxID=5286 RepID=A0A511K9T8_RHOTO|nr:40S ribosomal protein s7 [Rhodotorula toruloides]